MKTYSFALIVFLSKTRAFTKLRVIKYLKDYNSCQRPPFSQTKVSQHMFCIHKGSNIAFLLQLMGPRFCLIDALQNWSVTVVLSERARKRTKTLY